MRRAILTPLFSAMTTPDVRKQLVERVAASETFQRSRRLRDLLLFLGERAAQDPDRAVSEEEVAAAVFGRGADFDPTSDTLVRVQISQLRQKLLIYFATEGAAEPVVIELPKGSYIPLFRERDLASSPGPEAPGAAAAQRPAVSSRPAPMWIAAALLSVVLASLASAFLVSRSWKQRVDGDTPRPAAHGLWQQMFADKRTHLVVADSNVTLFQDLTRQSLSIAEYQNGQFDAIADKLLTTETERYMGRRLMHRQFTSIADARLVERLTRLASAHGPTEVLHARQVESQHFQGGHNVVLSGPRRANPWVSLFEDRLNFRTRFDEASRVVSFTNTAPQPGEAASYTTSWIEGGHCRVAFLPNLDRTGHVLIVSGTDMPSTDAGADLITRDVWVQRIYERLGPESRRRLPYFEILLRARRVSEATPEFDIVAHRIHKR
jgi:hypothetical protein